MKYRILLMGNTVEMAGGDIHIPTVYVDDDGKAKIGVGLDPAFCDSGSALCIHQTLISSFRLTYGMLKARMAKYSTWTPTLVRNSLICLRTTVCSGRSQSEPLELQNST